MYGERYGNTRFMFSATKSEFLSYPRKSRGFIASIVLMQMSDCDRQTDRQTERHTDGLPISLSRSA